MHEEIREQPDVLEAIWDRRNEIASLAAKVSKAPLVLFTAFGSSYNASLYGQFLFSHFAGIPAIAATPSFFLEQSHKLIIKKSLIIAVSQSGEVEEVLQAALLLKKRGGKILSITNDSSSRLAAISHFVLPLRAGTERSVPATKTFTATLFQLQILTAFLGSRKILRELSIIPESTRDVLAGEEKNIKKLAAILAGKSRSLILAPEALKPIAQEGGLKLKECAYLMAEPFEWREFFHGPVALMERTVPAILMQNPADSKTSKLVEQQVKRIGKILNIFSIHNYPKIRTAHQAAIPFAILFQLLAFHLSLLKRHNPDHPRHLHKITKKLV